MGQSPPANAALLSMLPSGVLVVQSCAPKLSTNRHFRIVNVISSLFTSLLFPETTTMADYSLRGFIGIQTRLLFGNHHLMWSFLVYIFTSWIKVLQVKLSLVVRYPAVQKL